MVGLLAHLGSFDAVVIGVFAVGMLFGYFQGMMRQIFFLGAIYFGMVLAAQYYTVAAAGLEAVLPGADLRAYSTVGLVLVFAGGVLFTYAIGLLAYRSTQLPKLAVLDHAGGAVLGAVSAYLVISLMLTTADFALATPLAGLEWAQTGAARLMHQSALVPMVHRSMPALYETLRPWVPTGLPAPFAA